MKSQDFRTGLYLQGFLHNEGRTENTRETKKQLIKHKHIF